MRSFAPLCVLACWLPILAQDAPPVPPPAQPARVHQAPKNLKILKPEEVRPAMGMFRASLGVTCAACHEQGDFASDAKPEKEIARKMILMTRQINSTFPAGVDEQHTGDHVTCYTCHNGASKPKITPPAAAHPATVPTTPPPAPPAQ